MANDTQADYFTGEILGRLDALSLYRTSEEPVLDDWSAAWESVDLARRIERDHLKAPSAVAIGYLYELYRVARYADSRLEAQGRTSADDNGTTAGRHVEAKLAGLCLRAIDLHHREAQGADDGR